MASPATLDFDTLLVHIAGDNPAGRDLTFEPDGYDVFRAERKAMATIVQTDMQNKAKSADWSEMIALAQDALTTASKDLQIAAWLLEALVEQYGFTGLRDGFRFLQELLETFWDSLYPECRGGRVYNRARPLESLDRDLAIAIRHIPLTQANSDKVYGWCHWEEAQEIARNRQKLDNPEKEKERIARLKELESTGRTAPEEFEKAVKSTPTVFYVNLLRDIQESQQEYGQLREVMKAKFGLDDTPKMENTPKLLETCYHFIQKTLEDRGPLEVVPPEETKVVEPAKDDAYAHGRFVDGQQGPHTLASSNPLAPQNRADALLRLEAVAAFFRSTEPHSPVPALVERAIKYEKLTLDTLLQQVIPDAKVLKTVRESLGFEEAVSPGDAE